MHGETGFLDPEELRGLDMRQPIDADLAHRLKLPFTLYRIPDADYFLSTVALKKWGLCNYRLPVAYKLQLDKVHHLYHGNKPYKNKDCFAVAGMFAQDLRK